MYNQNMSHSLRRLLLIFTLTVAIPFQAIASSLLFACEMTHGVNPPVSGHVHGDSSLNHHVDSGTGESIHAANDAQHMMSANAMHAGDHHASDTDSHNNHLKHSSCCSGGASGAVMSDTVFFVSPHNSQTEFTYISSRHLPPVLAGLDRPPRSFLV